ncbi:MAG: helix-turn-helix domain-containing protein [Bacteroidales bacterium]|nr:helix-turn-helix domain-containing protein [Bacteroidales bacterium]
MKELLEQIKLNPQESFFIGIFQDHIDQSRWHYHQEFELSFITEGSGSRIVGDSVEEFHPGDLIFIGPRIPHVWFSEAPVLNQHSGRTLESVYLLFNQAILPEGITSLPELKNVNRAIQLSERGIRITGDTLNQVSRIMLQLPYLNSMKRLMLFYEIMDIIGGSQSFTFLASTDYIKTRFESTNNRGKNIHEFLMHNYREEINLEEIAGIVHMAPASACRFFKSSTGLTIFEYLNKIKIDYACKLLLNTDLNIVDISYDCGFNNLSHFNKQFRKFLAKTPSQFRKLRERNP